ncbi:MAG: hypothetical protein M0Q90_09330 [Bacteroidales bacterium]|nr:hypothetical protein [Bacteroidales bacterium]
MAAPTKNKIRKLSLAQLLVGSFALTYYVLSVLMVATLLLFNRFILDTGHYDNGLKIIQSNSLVLVLVIMLLIVVGAVVGLVLFLLQKPKGLLLFVISAVLLMFIQANFGGFEGWQKFVVEIILIILLLIIPSRSTKIEENRDNNEILTPE